MKTIPCFCVLLAACVTAAPLTRAAEPVVVNLGTPGAPPHVCISNGRGFPVRLYVAIPQGQRYFLAELKPGEFYSRRMGPPLPSRYWVVTDTNDETLSSFTLGPGDSGDVALR